jgi:acetyl esterase
MVYFHGGGFVIGDLDTHDEPCRMLCRHGNTQVLSVAYRLAPESPFPAAVEDAQTAFLWAEANAASLGVDRARISIGGDSAGANLAGAVSLGPAQPFRQLLIYPPADMTASYPSKRLFGNGFLLSQHDCNAFYNHYAGTAAHRRDDPRLSLIKARNLATMPPALVAIAGFDVLRDEGEALATALQSAGARVRVLRFPSLEHGFIHMSGICQTARQAMIAIGREWNAL